MIDDELYTNYFGRAKGYYLSVFEDVKIGKKVILGVAPFFLNVFWMIYRKMYLYSFIILIGIYLTAEISNYLMFNYFGDINLKLYFFIQSMCIYGSFGLFGNWLYIHDAKRKITKLKSKYQDRDILIEKIRKQGGVNWILPLLFFAALILSMHFSNPPQSM